MNSTNSEYWEDRIAKNVWNTYNSLEDKNKQLLEMYKDASKSIREELYKLGEKYSKDGVLSLSEMHKQNRLNELNKKYENIAKELGGNVESSVAKNMKSGFIEVYSTVNTAFGNTDFSMPNKRLMNELLERPWFGDDFSGRLWKNQKRLTAALNSLLLTGLQQGKTVFEIASNLDNVMGRGFNDAHRLVRTETMHYLNQSAIKGYKDCGCAKVQLWAAVDERTCDTCGVNGYHGKIYPIDKAPILPFHAHCRCTYLPVIESLQSDVSGVILGDTTDKWSDQAKKELLADEKALAHRAKETTVVYDGKGKFMFQKRGTETQVSFTFIEALKLKGTIVTHNHPSGGSFSSEDIVFLKTSGAAEVRVSTEGGAYYLRPPKKWAKEIDSRDKVKEVHKEIKLQLRTKYQEMYKAGKINKAQRYQMWLDDVNRTFAEKYGLEFGKEAFE